MPPPKRFRPPNINLTLASEKRGPNIELEAESPLTLSESTSGEDDIDLEDTLQLSSDESSPATSPIVPILNLDISDDESSSDDISKDLEALEQLRRSVKKNLRLRPIRSHSALPKVSLDMDNHSTPKSPYPPSTAPWRDLDPASATSPASSTASSYFTPLTEAYASSPPSAQLPVPNPSSSTRPIQPGDLYERLTSTKRPLLIDTRLPASHVAFHIQHSINIAIPSLILKRCRKPGGGFQSLDALRQFITTEESKQSWDEVMSPNGPWDGSVVIYDDEMDPKEQNNIGVVAWALIPVLTPLLNGGSVDYLQGGISAGGHHPDLETLISSGGDFDFGFNVDSPPPQAGGGGLKKGGGLFQLDTQTASRSKVLPEIEPSSVTSTKAPSPPPRSPMPLMPGAITSSRVSLHTPGHSANIMDPTPSPPPSQVSFRRPPPPRRPSVPGLRRIDTKSAERLNANLPKLSVRTRPVRSATLAVPPSLSLNLQPPASPSHLNLAYSNHSPPGSARWTPSSPSAHDLSNFLTPYYTPPHTPGTPKPFLPPSPSTAKPELENLDDPPTTEEAFPEFTISTILPNFLYLGPELTEPEHVEELRELGVRRILNIAAECDDDNGLNLREVFEKYYKIPMRDTVEEENIAQGVKEVCEILDDARLHSAPTYVHCKAGKSRSVTAVMAYLIHANHWTLSRAYAFVLERRKGISPNIGFVSELMTFEEQELGGKSIGVHPSAPAGTSQHDQPGHPKQQENYGSAIGGNRRGGHVRESLPPAIGGTDNGMVDGGVGGIGGPISAGGLMDRINGDSGQEMEIKDSSGRYRHARRAPVDENTLQPMRRVSKAGLESSAYS
ncbi:hypothetical protein BDZ94DRAFT_922113 [Collybia nuda]|uniref:protein-tyrosine-phosphatase n=1 Tax=Collybia nuda TaxID=64659 RepID=A0A9P5XZ52_9AGAR|nr:hypothetical protein BDZ94DRAFT_922113 [Collybia nuda]